MTDANAGKLRSALGEFTSQARRTGGRVTRATSTASRNGSATASHEQSRAIREWARRNGYEVSNRGRIPASLIDAFEVAQSEAVSKTRRRTTHSSA